MIRDLRPGSVTRTLAEAFAREFATLYERLGETYDSAFSRDGHGREPRRPNR